MIRSRQDLADYALRQLGAPVLQINVADEQLDDRIDDAIQKFCDFHGDGAQIKYIAYKIKEKDVINKFIEVDDEVTSVLRVFPLNQASPKNLQYQAYISDLLAQVQRPTDGLHGYVISSMYLSMVQELFSWEKRIRFNRYTRQLSIDDDWNDIFVDSYIMIECYVNIDPKETATAYNDPWLKAYTTALIKKNWGQNLSKYAGVTLPSGIVLDGRAILDDANQEIQKLEDDLYNTYSLPLDFFIG